jgi:hypothetical protein
MGGPPVRGRAPARIPSVGECFAVKGPLVKATTCQLQVLILS